MSHGFGQSSNLNPVENPQKTIDSAQWFICKGDTGICEIIRSPNQEVLSNSLEIWGAFASHGEAIAKRVGLIRAGKCQPQ